MDKPRHGGHLVSAVLKREGVPNLFTLSGGHIAPIYDACVDEGIRIVDFRHRAGRGPRGRWLGPGHRQAGGRRGHRGARG